MLNVESMNNHNFYYQINEHITYIYIYTGKHVLVRLLSAKKKLLTSVQTRKGSLRNV